MSFREDGRLRWLNFYLGVVCLHRQLPLGMSTFWLFMQKEERPESKFIQASTKSKQGFLRLPGSRSLRNKGICAFGCFFVGGLFLPCSFLKQSFKTVLGQLDFFFPHTRSHNFSKVGKRPSEGLLSYRQQLDSISQSLPPPFWLSLLWPESTVTHSWGRGGGCLRDAPNWAAVPS